MEQAWECSLKLRVKGIARLKNELHAFWLGDNSRIITVGRTWRGGGGDGERPPHPGRWSSIWAPIRSWSAPTPQYMWTGLKMWGRMMHRSTQFIRLSQWRAFSFPSVPSSVSVSSFLCNFLPQQWMRFVKLQCKHSLLAHFLSHILSICSHGPIWCSLSLRWAGPQGLLGDFMPTSIHIILPEACPWLTMAASFTVKIGLLH